MLLEQQATPAHHDRDRRAQLVRQGREEFIFDTVGALRCGSRGLFGLQEMRAFAHQTAQVGHIRMHTDPLLQHAGGVEHGDRANRIMTPFPIVTSDTMLEEEGLLLEKSFLPRIDSRLYIRGMHGLRPPKASILVVRLSGKRRPVRLLAFHLARRIVSPDNPLHCIDCRSQPLIPDPKGIRMGFFGGTIDNSEQNKRRAVIFGGYFSRI